MYIPDVVEDQIAEYGWDSSSTEEDLALEVENWDKLEDLLQILGLEEFEELYDFLIFDENREKFHQAVENLVCAD